jgi:hypothetical protein
MRHILGHTQRVIAQADYGNNTGGLDSNYINLSNTFFEYNNPDLGINITYPADWQVTEFPGGNGVAFGVYLQGTGDRFGVQLGIFTIDKLPVSGEPIEQYFQRQVDTTLANVPDLALQTQPTSTIIDGNPALRADFINSTETIPSSFTAKIWTVKDNNKAYQIEASIDSRYYYDYLPIVQKMLDSLRIEDTQPNLAEREITDTDGFLTYENDTYGIRLKYPADWDYFGNVETGGFIDIALFQAPFEGRTDTSSAQFIVSMDTLPADRTMSLADYAEGIISNNELSDPTYNVLESSTNGSSITLLDRPAYRILATYVLDNITYTTMEIGTFVDGKVYVITYAADEAEFYKYQPIAQEMINSFEVLGVSGNTVTSSSDGGGGAINTSTNLVNTTLGDNVTLGSSSNITGTAMTMENQSSIPSSSTFVNYHEKMTYGVGMQYPSDWEIQENQNKVIFISPQESTEDLFREGVAILVQNIQFGNGTVMSLDGYVNSVIDSFKRSGSNISISDWIPTNLTLYPSSLAMKLVYTWNNRGMDMKTMDIYTINGNNAYTITYGSPVDKFDSFMPTVQKMIDSFEILPSQ